MARAKHGKHTDGKYSRRPNAFAKVSEETREMKTSYDVTKHSLVPKHAKASDKEKKELLEKYQISMTQLPRIVLSDPAIAHLDAEEGDIIRITRPSHVSGESTFYRRVVNG